MAQKMVDNDGAILHPLSARSILYIVQVARCLLVLVAKVLILVKPDAVKP